MFAHGFLSRGQFGLTLCYAALAHFCAREISDPTACPDWANGSHLASADGVWDLMFYGFAHGPALMGVGSSLRGTGSCGFPDSSCWRESGAGDFWIWTSGMAVANSDVLESSTLFKASHTGGR
jgi:hypothetical protein